MQTLKMLKNEIKHEYTMVRLLREVSK